MNKQIINVPKEIRYISEWPNFPLQQLSTGHCIVNKTITGCGYTHFCLTNNQPVILCSPRKFLLENKHHQLKDEYNTYLVINDGEKSLDIDGCSDSSPDLKSKKLKIDSGNDHISTGSLERSEFELITGIEGSIRNYIMESYIKGLPPKILVTYDSLKYVLNVLGDSISLYSIIIDEFQNIFMDSRFKADTELNFIDVLQFCPNVTYLSATPYIEEYLNELDEFKDLPYYELKWDSDRLQTIKINPKKVFRPNQEIDRIIQDYLEGRYPEKVNEESGEICQSMEVVFYMNSVRMITSTIIRNNLTPDQVNIICADTERNKRQLERIGHYIGTAPLKGDSHKMFTFCTRTTYAGADFYSTNALSVIVSDCKIDSLSTDIRMDFPQIMGRQRLKENVFRDECIFIYKLSDETITMEEFERISKEKLRLSQVDLNTFRAVKEDSLTDNENLTRMMYDLRLRIKTDKYSGDYTGIQERTGTPVINKLVMISERRAFELRSNVYKNDVQVYNEFAKVSTDLSYEDFLEREETLNSLRFIYNSTGTFESKMRSICDFLLNPRWFGHVHISDLFWLPLSVRNYLIQLGPKRIKEIGCREGEIRKELLGLGRKDKPEFPTNIIKSNFSKEFIIGERYSLKNIKKIISKLYTVNGITKTPKATDLEEFFNVRKCTINLKDGKRVNGYEILSLKE